MSYLQLDNPIRDQFAMVPDVLWTWPGLSFKAKGFFAYLLSFRHGVCPPVAAMEAQTGLGRDARKAVMRELQAAGLARWIVKRDPAGRVVAKFLEVTTRPMLAAMVAAVPGSADAAAIHAPENPSHGSRIVHAPENPLDGKEGAALWKNRAASAENPAIKEKKQKEKRARDLAAGSASGSPRRLPLESGGAALDPARLTPFQRSCVLADQSVQVAGDLIAAGSPQMRALRSALRGVRRDGAATAATVSTGGAAGSMLVKPEVAHVA